MGRLEAAERQDHLPRGAVLDDVVAPTHLDPARAVAVEPDPGGERVDLDGEVGSTLGGMEEGVGRAHPTAVADRGHRVADALVVARVQVVDLRHAQFAARGDHVVAERIPVAGRGDVQRTAGAAEGGRPELVVLEAAVHRQDRRPAPAGVSQRLDRVPVGLAPAVVDHAVDRARAAEHLAAHPVLDLVGGAERLRREVPDELRVAEQLAEALRDSDHRVLVATTRFEHEHGGRPVGREPIGEHATGGTGTDDDVVELVHHHSSRGNHSRMPPASSKTVVGIWYSARSSISVRCARDVFGGGGLVDGAVPAAGDPDEDAREATVRRGIDPLGELARFAGQEHDQRRDELRGGRQLHVDVAARREREVFLRDVLGPHPGGDAGDRGRGHHVGADPVRSALERDDARQTGDPRFGRRVVGLVGEAEEPRPRRREDEAPVPLVTHHPVGGLAHVERAEQVRLDDAEQLFVGQLPERVVAEDPRVVDDHIEPAERGRRDVDDRLATLGGGDAVVRRHRPPAGRQDLGDHPVGALVGASGAVDRDAEVVHHHRRTPACELERVRPAEPVGRAGDQHDPSVEVEPVRHRVHRAVTVRTDRPYPLGQGRRRSRPVPWTDSWEQPTDTGGGTCVTSWSWKRCGARSGAATAASPGCTPPTCSPRCSGR